jgi:hypothetical protein
MSTRLPKKQKNAIASSSNPTVKKTVLNLIPEIGSGYTKT